MSLCSHFSSSFCGITFFQRLSLSFYPFCGGVFSLGLFSVSLRLWGGMIRLCSLLLEHGFGCLGWLLPGFSVFGLLCATKLLTLVLLHSSFVMGCLRKMNGSSPDAVRNHYAQSNAVSTFSSAVLTHGGAALRHAAVGCSVRAQSMCISPLLHS